MALHELSVAWVDAAAAEEAPRAVFVRCRRENSKTKQQGEMLHIELVQDQQVWSTSVTRTDKPKVLDCSADEYLRVLERALSPSIPVDTARGVGIKKGGTFDFKWSQKQAALTLMERTEGAAAGFAMKYATLQFESMEGVARAQYWQEMLHAVVVSSQKDAALADAHRQRLDDLERMLVEKDRVLDAALLAKQRFEDECFAKFCAVLNAKKDEIERLQHEVAIAQVKADSDARSGAATTTKRKSGKRAPAARKQPGARLRKRKQPSGEEESESESEQSDDGSASSGHDDEQDDEEEAPASAGSKQSSRQAVAAYARLPSMPSQVCTANDVLTDLDAIMDHEVAADEKKQMEMPSPRDKKRGRAATLSATSSRANSRAGKKPKVEAEKEPTKPPRTTPAKKSSAAKVSKPPPKPATDSEEDDILDMLA